MNKSKILRGLLLVLWMFLIFTMSHRPAAVSDVDSAGLIESVKVVQKSVNQADLGIKLNFSPVYYVRKSAHVFLFAVLTGLAYLWFYNPAAWGLSLVKALGFSLIYAMLDEWHQSFIPGRTGLWQDVVIDAYGLVLTAILIILYHKLVNSKRQPNT